MIKATKNRLANKTGDMQKQQKYWDNYSKHEAKEGMPSFNWDLHAVDLLFPEKFMA